MALVLAVVLSYFSIRAAIATHFANLGTLEGYEKARHLEPSNAEYWYLLGNALQYDIQHPDPQRAIQAYRVSLSLNSRSAEAWLELASVYEGQGDLNAAHEALLNAKNAFPVSADVSWRYANFLLRTEELDLAFHEGRQAVEQQPQRASEAFRLFSHFDSDVNELSDRLLPRRQDVYLDVIWGLSSDGQTTEALKVWDRLFELHKEIPQHGVGVPRGTYQLASVILFSLVDRLLSKGLTTEARRVWDEALAFMSISQQHDPPQSLVWDGGFESDVTGGPFSWRFDPPPGSVVQFDKSIKHSGTRALEIKFDGKRNLDFQGVCQRIVVTPKAAYDFSAWVQTDAITTERGIFFRLSTPGKKSPDVPTTELTGSQPWTRVGVRWEAPKDVQLLQVCIARAPSNHVYNEISGTAWVDDIELLPVKSADDPF
jgi:tetratricopeptide (TPR) repeat protein